MSQTKAQLISGTSSQDVTFDDATVSSLNGGALSGARNRIINGDMRIDQRNAGASVTPGDGAFTLDRWKASASQASKFSVQRSSTAPSGFTNSILLTSLSAYTVASGETFGIYQPIEGFNVADLGWGAAGAQSVAVSFWVRASITGTYSVTVFNAAANRSCSVGYTVNSANTWEYKTVTIAGDTTGTWTTDNTQGIAAYWTIGGVGSTSGATSGTWNAGLKTGVTGQASVVGTNGATFYITGVQLEAGSVATPFERRSYGQELALCQRYYAKSYGQSVAPGAVSSSGRTYFVLGSGTNTANKGGNVELKVTMRASPTVILYNEATGASGQFAGGATANYLVFSESNFAAYAASSSAGELYAAWTASAEL